jgi:cytosine deaminase
MYIYSDGEKRDDRFLDLVIRNAKLRSGKTQDIGVAEGRIVEIKERIKEKGSEEIDAQEKLTTSSFVNPHVHLDKCLTGEWTRTAAQHQTGTLDILPLAAEIKRRFTEEDIQRRALSAIKTGLLYGTTAIRTFADVDTIGELMAVKSLLKVKERVKGIVDLQVVAFPQEGIIRDAGTEDLMHKAMELGADVVGGIPWYEYIAEDSKKHIDIAFEIAKQYNKDIHMLIDDTDDPDSKNIEYLAYKAFNEGWIGRVSASHCRGALETPNDIYGKKVVDLAKRAEMSIVDNSHIGLLLYGRQDKYPIRRGTTRVKEFLRAGVNVTIGQDDMDDPYYPFGKNDMLELGYFMIHSAHFGVPTEIETAYDMITSNAARALRLRNYGLALRKNADLVILNATNVHDAFKMQAERIHVIKNGKVVAKTQSRRMLKASL